MKKVYAINLGSTSTKVAYSEDGAVLYKEAIAHASADLAETPDVFDQQPFRMEAIRLDMQRHGIAIADLDAIVSRGGLLQPLPVGVFQVNDAMVAQLRACSFGKHPASIGCVIARELAEEAGALALTADVPSSDELTILARYTGLPEMQRTTMTQALNARAQVRAWAREQGRTYADVNVLTVGLGGGINVIAHQRGRMVDTNNSVDGEGCFSTNRCLSVPIDQLIEACYAKERTYDEMMTHVCTEGGLVGYVGTADMREIEARIAQGDAYADEVVSAMCYQVAKDVGAFACALAGEVDAIILTGGMAHSVLVVERITERVQWIAPVVVRPGELEMEALCESAYRALVGDVPIQEFVAAASRTEACERIAASWKEKGDFR